MPHFVRKQGPRFNTYRAPSGIEYRTEVGVPFEVSKELAGDIAFFKRRDAFLAKTSLKKAKREELQKVAKESDFETELESLKGIGDKTVKDILLVVGTKEEMIRLLKEEPDKLYDALRDNVVDTLKEVYLAEDGGN